MPPLLSPGRRRGVLRVTLLALAQGAAAALAAFATRDLFRALNGPDQSLPALPLALLILSGAAIALTRVLARIEGERLGQGYALEIRCMLFEHAAGMAISDVAARRSGFMSLRFVGDMTAFRNWAGRGLPRLVAGAVQIPAALAVLWWLAPVFLGAAGGPVGVALLAVVLGGAGLVPLHRRLRRLRARIAADMAERMPLAPELDRLGRRPRELRRLRRHSAEMIRASLTRLRMAETLKAAPDLMAGLAAALLIRAGAGAGLEPGTIAGALAALGLTLTPLRNLAGALNHYSAWRTAHARCAAALARTQRAPYGRLGLPGGPVALRIRNLPLPGTAPLSCDLRKGRVAQLSLDEPAATALFNMLLGLEPPQSGTIRLSGIAIGDLSRGSLRRNVCRLGPLVPLLQGSLRRALTIGLDIAPDDARLTARIAELGLTRLLEPVGGLDARIGEGGRTLPAATRTAISLVRAALARPRLILIGQDIAAAGPELADLARRWSRASGSTVLCAENSAPAMRNR